jgi:hypothetical protein
MKKNKNIKNFIQNKLAKSVDHSDWKKEWKNCAKRWLRKTYVKKTNDISLGDVNESKNELVKMVSHEKYFRLYRTNFDEISRHLPINLWIELIMEIFEFGEERYATSLKKYPVPSLGKPSIYRFLHKNYWHQILANHLHINIKGIDGFDANSNSCIAWCDVNYKNLIFKSNLEEFNDKMKKNVAFDIFYNLADKYCCKEETEKIKSYSCENICVTFKFDKMEIKLSNEFTLLIKLDEAQVVRYKMYNVHSFNLEKNYSSVDSDLTKLFLITIFELYSLFDVTGEEKLNLPTFVEDKTSFGKICQALKLANLFLVEILGKDITNIINEYTRITDCENFRYNILA